MISVSKLKPSTFSCERQLGERPHVVGAVARVPLGEVGAHHAFWKVVRMRLPTYL